jgi:hypothetical protein
LKDVEKKINNTIKAKPKIKKSKTLFFEYGNLFDIKDKSKIKTNQKHSEASGSSEIQTNIVQKLWVGRSGR